eukprot:gene842-932_t
MRHDPLAASQNLGNSLDLRSNRSCVRQTHFYRMHESGNAAKEAMGLGSTKWNLKEKEGCFKGAAIEDPYNSGQSFGGVRKEGKKVVGGEKEKSADGFLGNHFNQNNGASVNIPVKKQPKEVTLKVTDAKAPPCRPRAPAKKENAFRTTSGSYGSCLQLPFILPFDRLTYFNNPMRENDVSN